MPIRLPSNLYSGGAVVFNNQPSVNLYAQLMARKQARQESLDQYYQNLHKNINAAGMRTQDISGGFSEKVAGWEKHFMENRQKILNPRTPQDREAAIQNQSMYQDLLMDVQKSKDASQQELELGKQKLSGKWNPTESDLQVAHKISNSIYSQDYYKDKAYTQPYTINDLSLNVPEFYPKAQEEFDKASLGDMKPGKIYDEKAMRKDKSTGQVFIPFQQSFSEDQIKRRADMAANLVTSSRSAKVHYERLLDDPNWVVGAGNAYKQVYGGDGILRTPQEAAKADAILKTKRDITSGEELRKDETLAFQRQQMMENIRQANRIEMLGLHEKAKALGAASEDVWIDNYIDKVTEDAKQGNKGLFGAGKEGYEISIDPTIAKAFTRDGKSPDKLVVTVDGKYVPIFYKRDKDGNLLPKEKGSVVPAVSDVLSVPISKEQFKLAMGGKAGVKQLNKEMSNQGQTQKKYSYNGKTYSYEQIEKAAKQNNLSVEDYIKKAGIK